MMAICNMTTVNFEGKTAGDAFLDKKWKCRVCKLLAGSHPPPPSAGSFQKLEMNNAMNFCHPVNKVINIS
jgi:hypothetical protein